MYSSKKIAVVMLVLILSLLNYNSVNAEVITNKQEKWFDWIDENYVQKSRGIDQDDYAGEQCVDVASNYAATIFPFNNHRYDYKKSLGIGNANDLLKGANPNYFEKIRMKKGFIPKRGDIAVWGENDSIFGHVGVVKDADKYGMRVIHQHGSYQNGIKSERLSYNRISGMGTLNGFLRPIKTKIIEKDSNVFFVSRGSSRVLKASKLIRKDAGKKEIDKDGFNTQYHNLVKLSIFEKNQFQKPNWYLTRLDALHIVSKLANITSEAKRLDISQAKEILAEYKDSDSLNNDDKKLVALAVYNKIINGIKYNDKTKLELEKRISPKAFLVLALRALQIDEFKYKTVENDLNFILARETEHKDILKKEFINTNDAASLLYELISKGIRKDKKAGIYRNISQFLVMSKVIDIETLKKVLD